jgi:hypothetical protein
MQTNSELLSPFLPELGVFFFIEGQRANLVIFTLKTHQSDGPKVLFSTQTVFGPQDITVSDD